MGAVETAETMGAVPEAWVAELASKCLCASRSHSQGQALARSLPRRFVRLHEATPPRRKLKEARHPQVQRASKGPRSSMRPGWTRDNAARTPPQR